jgi:hypothetical protein
LTWKWGRSYLLKLWVVVQADPGLDLEDGETVADEVAVVRGSVPSRSHQAGQLLVVGAQKHFSQFNWGQNIGGVAAVLVIGEYLEEDVVLDGLECPLGDL